ncbi:regulatory protein RecX [Acidaminococcus fermentans]|uniref:Regulatory protein RecX n=1 Tax=Acidaminococcus fermentans TaxID=905 RepID=A0A6N7VK77_ACIFE|nr:regulatory protein RecX [Acidaminococcus fermentans]MSS81460.1 regulatory protein RecX [Acidaminococcus fermentans]
MWSKSKKLLTTHAEAYNFCLDKLALRDHSTRELRQKLGERGCPEELQDQVLQKLADHHFVDDARCARSVLDAWRRKKFYGKQYLRLMLTRRCLSGEDAREALGEVTEEEETDRALALAQAQGDKIRRKYPEDPRKAKAALARMLASRGFGTGPIAMALEDFSMEFQEPETGFPPLARD